ncbi:MAG: hypothetical protein GF331_20795 [Chitinivibrionales bacterium]|nr:hypothetical protein [Chitinivibrionales bacterium]
MGFNPLKETGTPLEQQFRNWDRLNVTPYDKDDVHPYSRTRIILMNGIEVESALFMHQLARHTEDISLKQQLAAARRVEQQQQKMINWFSPGDESVLETTIGYEQVAVDLTAWLARTEPNQHVKAALDFALIEDFDHLYRYANILDLQGIQAEQLCGGYTEIFPGRPTVSEHRHPQDSIRNFVDYTHADMLTKLHIMVIVAGEQQTMNFYMNAGNTYIDPITRGLYQEIGMIEEQHVTHYESLADPRSTWAERLLLHQYTECYMYYSCMQEETDSRIRQYWERMLSDEIEHLKMAADLYKQYEQRDPAAVIPDDMPELVRFQSNKEYVRDILRQQVDYTADRTEYRPAADLPDDHSYKRYQAIVNEGFVPSQEAIEQHIQDKGVDYRSEPEGSHPVERFRERKRAVV